MVAALTLGLIVGGPGGASAHAQELAPIPRGAGTVTLTHWPENLAAMRRDFPPGAYQLLPRMEALSLQYQYAGTEQGVQMTVSLSWTPGDQALYEGAVVPYRALPDSVRMVAVELTADVIVESRDVADLVVTVDSMMLAPYPDGHTFEVRDLPYGQVFPEVTAAAARAYFRTGFTLANLTVQRIAFTHLGDATGARSSGDVRHEPAPPVPPPVPHPRWSIFAPRIGFVIGWHDGPDGVFGDRPRRNEAPRRGQVGRTAEASAPREQEGRGEEATRDEQGNDASDAAPSRGKQAERGGEKERSGEDDEDEDSLVPASLAALGVVGLAAVAGGTVGLHGRGETPLGLMAGYVTPRAGGLVQASVNGAVLGGEGTQRLEAKLLFFYDAFGAPVQPALGLGTVAEVHGDDTVLEPSLSLGAAANLGRIVLVGGYDVVRGTPELGLAINFRFAPSK